MARELPGKRIAILAIDGVERVEAEQPRGALYGAGAACELLSIHPGEVQGRQFEMVSAGTFPVAREVSDASAEDFQIPHHDAHPLSSSGSHRWRIASRRRRF